MRMRQDPRADRLGFAYFALLAVTLIVQYGAAFLVGRVMPGVAESEVYPWLLSLLPIYAVGLPICLLLLRPCAAEPRRQVPMATRFWWLSLLMALGLMFFGNLIGNALMMLVAALRGEAMVNPVQEAILGSHPLYTALATVVVAPLGEEFIFRRLIIDRVRRYGELSAVLLSAAMFGAFHLNFYQFFYAALVGLVFGYVYVKTGRLRYTVALHAAINALGGVVAPALLRAVMPVLESLQNGDDLIDPMLLLSRLPALLAYLGYAALLFGAAVAVPVIAIAAHRRLSFARGEGGRRLWCSIPILAFFALCAVMAILSV